MRGFIFVVYVRNKNVEFNVQGVPINMGISDEFDVVLLDNSLISIVIHTGKL